MEMYEAIFKRKSIRNYDMNSLDFGTINDIKQYIETIKPYNSDIKTQTYILDDESKISGMWKVKAPHYIAITSEKKDDYLVNVGYILEQLAIYLTTKGLGTCWLGGAKPIEEMDKENPLDFVVMIAFGKPTEPIYRLSTSEFKRKDISQISNLTERDNIMEAVRLSPSAMNQQAWYFEVKENEISVYRKTVIKMMEKMATIDIGIAIAHIYIAAQGNNKNVGFSKENNMDKKGYEYIVTCKLI